MAFSPSSCTACKNTCSRVKSLFASRSSFIRVLTLLALMPNVSNRGMLWFANNSENSSMLALASRPIAVPRRTAIVVIVSNSSELLAMPIWSNLLA